MAAAITRCGFQEEINAKKASRQERFGGGVVDGDEAKKKQRMERFGLA
jgi:hypothetical protein